MKERIKRNVLRAYKFKSIPDLLHAYFLDLKAWVKYSLSYQRTNKLHQQAELLLSLHSLEKGLSFTPVKAGFGGDKANYLLGKSLIMLT